MAKLIKSGNINPIVGASGIITLDVSTSKNPLSDYADFGVTLEQVLASDMLQIQVLGTNSINYTYGIVSVSTTEGVALAQYRYDLIIGRDKIRRIEFLSQTGTTDLAFAFMTYGSPSV